MPPTKAKGADATSSSRTDADDASSGKVSGGPVELPLHLTEKILCSISPLASARLATVCKSWAATISKRLARPIPHLFVYLPADNKSDRRGVVFVETDHGSAVIPNRVRLADTNGLRCIGAMPSGYLAFANWFCCESSVVLVNPITGARQIVHVEKILGRNPVVAAGGADSFIVSTGADELGLWLRAGGAEEWSKWTVAAAGHRPDGVMLVALRNGCFYVLDRDGYVFLIDAAAPPTPTPLRMEKLPVASLFDQFVPPSSSPVKGHFVEADGEVLFVRRVLAAVKEDRGIALCHHDVVREDYFSIVGFEVYRLDVKDHRWTKVMKLAGDRTLFVSPRSSLAVRSSETEGCRSNCIYFIDEKPYCPRCNLDDGNTWGVYSMEDGEVLFKHACHRAGTMLGGDLVLT